MPPEMDYRLLGGSGLRVSEYALGTMTFGEDWGWGAGEAACAEMFEQYVKAGGNFVDTANNYTDGTAERIVGSLLADHGRERFVLATKYSLTTRPDDPNAGGNHRKNLFQSVEASLARLETDYVDLLWMHAYDGLTPIEEVMRALDDLVRQGTVHYVGVSDAPAWWVARAQTLAAERGLTPFAAMQVKYALTERTVERELRPAAEHLGMGVTAWGPLDGGVLTGKYLAGDEGRYSQQGREMNSHQQRVVEAVVSVADELDCTPAQVALAWLRERDVIPILGATKPEHLADNLGSLDVSLDADATGRLEEASAVEMGFPRAFLESDMVRELVFGELAGRVRDVE
jgi:aryl-alcohol dehydrogenase-like predicted oxidoreductase